MPYDVVETERFSRWLARLSDDRAKAIIARRVDKIRRGLFGEHESVGDAVSEMKIDYGPGYRVYYVERGRTRVILLCGGNKGSQSRDIKQAKQLAKEV